MAQKEGHEKFGGREKGTPNKSTQETRVMIQNVLEGCEEKIKTTLRALDGKDYIDALSKLLPYVVPKKTDITSGDQSIIIRFDKDDEKA